MGNDFYFSLALQQLDGSQGYSFPLKVCTTKLWNSLTQDVSEPKSINRLQGGLDKLM